MANRIAIFEGYGLGAFAGTKRRKARKSGKRKAKSGGSGRTANQRKFGACAKSCYPAESPKGLGKCMKVCMRKGKR